MFDRCPPVPVATSPSGSSGRIAVVSSSRPLMDVNKDDAPSDSEHIRPSRPPAVTTPVEPVAAIDLMRQVVDPSICKIDSGCIPTTVLPAYHRC